VPLSEKVEDLNDLPIICQIDDKRIFALNFSKEFEVERQRSFDKNSEEFYYDLAKGIGLKKFEQKLLPSFAFKLMQSLPCQGTFNGVQVGQSIGNVLRQMEDKKFGVQAHQKKNFEELHHDYE
jgi:hypothetical protein